MKRETHNLKPILCFTFHASCFMNLRGIVIILSIVLPVILICSPLNESFTGTTFPPIGWRVINNDVGAQSWSRRDTLYRTSPSCASSRYESGTLRNDDWLISSKLICSPNTFDTLKFYFRKVLPGTRESLVVRLSITDNDISSFSNLLWATGFSSTSYNQKVLALDTFDGYEVYIAFINKGLYQGRINLDDITGPEMIEIRDVGVDSILSPLNTFIMRPVGAGFYPQARIKNYSNATQRNIPVICSIAGQFSTRIQENKPQIHTGKHPKRITIIEDRIGHRKKSGFNSVHLCAPVVKSAKYENIKYIDSLLVDSSKTITFDLFVPTIAEPCTVKIRTFLANDTNPANNFKSRTTQIIRGNYTGGPDANFFYWIDSDTIGGPIYNWIDISVTGNPLPSGDAWVGGPIAIGFIFNYNGEGKNSFYYSTNGFICFDYISLSYNANQSIPNPAFPNNIITPFWDDLYTLNAYHQTFGSSPNRYKVVQWNAGIYEGAVLKDTVIFQAILYEYGDIVFQYNYCGNRYNLGQGQSATIGIENSSGTSARYGFDLIKSVSDGLQYLYNGTPLGNLLNSGRTIRFYRQCHDVMLDSILTSQAGIGDAVFPQVVVKNIGTYTESFSTVFNIRNIAQTLIYSDTIEIANLPSMASRTVSFDRQWVPSQFGTYPAKAWTTLSNDINQQNDTCYQDIAVLLAAPILLTPSNGYITNNRNVLFDWTDVPYATRYNLIIDGIVDTIINLSQYGPRTFSEGNFHWRVRAGNQTTWGLWSQIYSFTIDTTRPSAPILIAPRQGCTLATPRPEFIWRRIPDAVNYKVLIFSTFDTFVNQIIQDTLYVSNISLPNGAYFWKVCCQDLATNWSNYSETRIFYLQYQVWYQRADIPEINSNKPVGAGGCITSVRYGLRLKLESDSEANDKIYALKGNNTQDFYEYDIITNQWTQKCSMPFFVRTDTSLVRKKVKSGAAIVYADSLIFALKGNHSNEFWSYDKNRDIWKSKSPVPATRKIKEGSCLAYYNGDIYCLVGKSPVFEFYKYNIQSDKWGILSPAPEGKNNRRFRVGSCMVYAGGENIHCLKGGAKYNEFYAYDIIQNQWSELDSVPNYHPQNRKRCRIRAGGSLAFDGNNSIYAIKGGGRNEFWKYNIFTGQWSPLETIPRLNKRSVPKAGAGLSYADNQVWLLKGNKTREFWTYLANQRQNLPVNYQTLNNTEQSVSNEIPRYTQNDKQIKCQKIIISAIGQKSATITFVVSEPKNISVKLYNLEGRLIKVIDEKYLSRGNYREAISLDNLPKGVYFIVIE